MAVTTARTYVQAPVAPTSRYGLFRVATGPLSLPLHSRTGGLEYESPFCTLPVGYAVACEPGSSKDFETGYDLVEGDPFVVLAATVCGTGGLGEERASRLAVDRLKAGEQAAVEDIFSRGTFGIAPSLGNNADVVELTATTSIVTAVAELEEWLYSRYGLAGTLHVPLIAGAPLMNANIIRYDTGSGIWFTDLGTKVSIGNYAGLEKDGDAPAAGHTTLYITGEVTIWRDSDSDIFVSPYGQNVNRTTNQSYMVAERSYAMTLDCHIANVDLDLAP